MPKKTIAMIHTVPGAAEQFEGLVKEIIGPLHIIHTQDGAALAVLLKHGGLCPDVYRRVIDDIMLSEQAGAEVIQVTCSSISPVVDLASKFVSVPVLKVDEPMIRAAVRAGSRIVIAATARTTLAPTESLLRAVAAELHKPVTVTTLLCEEVYHHLLSSDFDAYHEGIAARLLEVMGQSDAVVLAQASMTGAVNKIPQEKRTIPVLSSPRLAIEHLKQYV